MIDTYCEYILQNMNEVQFLKEQYDYYEKIRQHKILNQEWAHDEINRLLKDIETCAIQELEEIQRYCKTIKELKEVRKNGLIKRREEEQKELQNETDCRPCSEDVQNVKSKGTDPENTNQVIARTEQEDMGPAYEEIDDPWG